MDNDGWKALMAYLRGHFAETHRLINLAQARLSQMDPVTGALPWWPTCPKCGKREPFHIHYWDEPDTVEVR